MSPLRNIWLLCLVAGFLIPALSYAQVMNTEVEAEIDLQSKDRFIRIKGFATNKTDINRSLRYELSVIKTDSASGNRSKNQQQGRFVIGPQEKRSLSETTINAGQNDRTIIFLLLYEGDRVIGQDRIVLNGFEGEDELEPLVIEREELTKQPSEQAVPKEKQNDGVTLRGVVVEDTKTKPGSDFYQMFYSSYLANNVNGERIIRVVEKLAMGRSTKIQIWAEQDLIFEFFVNPREEYLKQMSEQAIFRVRRYFQTLKARQNQQQKY
ncbi:curli production assembly/transport protein CsgE [Robertkochia aurantiaca]|uniref:curli production assembly/transport protein CsgE n=1 Tax=Robertkochia aurantiaca TaxID=2873700 RepID=UPI001CCE5C2C|nr:curli production assembly/transport protein CsgE [Robertkochia sp. 3YJGBD-33]